MTKIKTLRTVRQLQHAGLIRPGQAPDLDEVASRYTLALPQHLAELIDANDANDPIARQFIPDARELVAEPQELGDPIGDGAHSPVEGIVHRYPDRVLLKLTPVCAVYCRFCFRREMVGPEKGSPLSVAALARALDYIKSKPEIWEVILTGGDPLVLSARRLRAVMQELGSIGHVKVLRIHTRIPVAEPARVTAELVRALKVKSKPTYIAVHVNHARELTEAARAACARLADAGVPLLAQSVLLKGVNDTVEAMAALLRACVECRIKPYYLHHPDLAPGTSHLRADIQTGQALVRGLRGRLSGLCQPSYVLDIPGGHGKSPIGPSYLTAADSNGSAHYVVEDFTGACHDYPPSAHR